MMNSTRKSGRLKKYSYRKPGAYFVTFATREMTPFFGEVIERKMHLNELGAVAEEEWRKTAQMRPGIELDEFVVMPNHIHAIIRIKDWGAGKLGEIIAGYKAAVSSRILKEGSRRGPPQAALTGALRAPSKVSIWHRGYYERIIRNERELQRIREYIRRNPEKWGRGKKD
jgi:putative transposase